ncbi:thiolase C-terminal domain-containing protein [Glaciimonas sp. GG7]
MPGLCGRGESGAFVEGGQRIARDVVMPINTNGGQLSGGRRRELGYVHQACLQLWGRAGERQVTPHQVAVTAARSAPLGGEFVVGAGLRTGAMSTEIAHVVTVDVDQITPTSNNNALCMDFILLSSR